MILTEVLRLIKENKEILKVNLTVNSSQLSAIKLYELFGFKTVGKLSKELLINGKYFDELLMEFML